MPEPGQVSWAMVETQKKHRESSSYSLRMPSASQTLTRGCKGINIIVACANSKQMAVMVKPYFLKIFSFDTHLFTQRQPFINVTNFIADFIDFNVSVLNPFMTLFSHKGLSIFITSIIVLFVLSFKFFSLFCAFLSLCS